jgi:hypothetical protein
MADAGVLIQVIIVVRRAYFAAHAAALHGDFNAAKRRWMAAADAGAEMPYTPGMDFSFAPPEPADPTPPIEAGVPFARRA